MKENILYLRKMGCDDENILTDVKNHRVRVTENIDIIFNGKPYNMFFEFTQCTHYNYRTTNKRTGAKLKKPVREIIIKDGLYLDTSFEDNEGCCRHCKLEEKIWKKHLAYTQENILSIVNRYKAGNKFTSIKFID